MVGPKRGDVVKPGKHGKKSLHAIEKKVNSLHVCAGLAAPLLLLLLLLRLGQESPSGRKSWRASDTARLCPARLWIVPSQTREGGRTSLLPSLRADFCKSWPHAGE